jgi:DNA repair protein RadC
MAPAGCAAPTAGPIPDPCGNGAASSAHDETGGGAARPRRRAPAGEQKDTDSAARRRTPNEHAGHRSRLRERLARDETLADYELAELVLFRSIPVQDTKPVAKALIRRFGSFAAALSAPPAQLREVRGVGDAVVADFRIVRAAAERLALGEIKARETLSSTDAVVAYYRTKLRGAEREEFHVLYLDKKNGYLASERAQVGTVDHTPVYPREVLKRAIELGASAIVLVHNHPSGDPAPSRADIAMTARIVEALAPVGITVHDHLVIGASGHVSLRGAGHM